MTRDIGGFGPFQVGGIFGVRYMGLDESFTLTSFDDAPGPVTGLYEIDTQNHLYGGQFGIVMSAGAGRVSMNWETKGGLFYNDAEQETAVFNNGALGIDTGRSRGNIASVVQSAAELEWQATDNISFGIGYEAMRLGGVARRWIGLLSRRDGENPLQLGRRQEIAGPTEANKMGGGA